MRDYLGNLAERTLGTISVVEPRIASRFEPAPTMDPLASASPPLAAPRVADVDVPPEVESLHPSARMDRKPSHLSFAGELPLSPMPPPVMSIPPRTTVPPVTHPYRAITEQDESLPAGQPIDLGAQHAVSQRGRRVTSPLDTGSHAELSPQISRNINGGELALRPAPAIHAESQTHFPGDMGAKSSSEPILAADRPLEQQVTESRHPDAPPRHQPIEGSPPRVEVQRERERIIETIQIKQSNVAEVDKPAPPYRVESSTRANAAETIREPAVPSPKIIVQPSVMSAPRLDSIEPAVTQQARAETTAAQPTIQVTIGRIEVRATPPPAPTPSRKATAPTTRSLEEYLRARNGADR